MTTTAIRKKLINYLENADEKKIKAVYTIFEDDINDENLFSLSGDHIKILDRERKKHAAGKSKSYSWEEAKKIIRGEKKK